MGFLAQPQPGGYPADSPCRSPLLTQVWESVSDATSSDDDYCTQLMHVYSMWGDVVGVPMLKSLARLTRWRSVSIPPAALATTITVCTPFRLSGHRYNVSQWPVYTGLSTSAAADITISFTLCSLFYKLGHEVDTYVPLSYLLQNPILNMTRRVERIRSSTSSCGTPSTRASCQGSSSYMRVLALMD